MAVNRFTNLTPSTYNPMTLQEIMMTPLAMRKKHDDLLAQQELIRSGLAKTDPYDNHFEEAVQLKKEIESQMDNLASNLSSNGFNNDAVSKTIALNRRYNDLISPTGKLGQINQHKIDLQNTYKNYIDDAVKMGNSQDVAELWAKEALQKHMTEPGWDENGRINKFKIDKAPVKYQDVRAIVNDLASKAGFDETSKGWAMDNIAIDTSTGMSYVKGESGKKLKGSNYVALNNLVNYMNNEVLRKDSDIHKVLDYTRQDINSVLQSIKNQSEIYKSSKDHYENGMDISNLNMPDGNGSNNNDNNIPTGITDPESQRVINENKEEYDYSKIGTSTPVILPKEPTPEQIKEAYGKSKQTYKDIIKDPIERKLYENTYYKLIKAGKIHKNRSMNDPLAAKAIQTYMNNHIPSIRIGNSVIRIDSEPNAEMFAGTLNSKDANQRNANAQLELEGGFRNIIDPTTGEKMDVKEFRDKGYKVEYIGYDSPINFRGYNFGDNLNENVMAHKVILKDSDGKVIGTTAMSRTKEEKEMPQFKASYIINNSYKNAVLNTNEWTPIGPYSGLKDENQNKFKGYKMKYNEEGTIDIKDPKGNMIISNAAPDSLKSFVYNKYFTR
jgi:hypothetical protein